MSGTEIDRRYAEAVSAYKSGHRQRAERILTALLIEHPGHSEASYLAALVALADRRLEEGRRRLQALLLRSPEHIGARYSLGKVLLTEGRRDDAARLFGAVLEADPGHVEAALEQAEIARAGNPAEALRILETALAVAPDDLRLINNLVELRIDGGHPAAGLPPVQRALQRRPDDPQLLYLCANAHRAAGDLAEAEALFRRAVSLAPAFEQAWQNLGNLLIDQGRPGEAIDPYRNAHRIRRRLTARGARDQISVSITKLEHDIEQLEYLVKRGLIAPELGHAALDAYRRARASVPASADGPLFEVEGAAADGLAPLFNGPLHVPDLPALAGPAVNPALDAAAITSAYRATGPGIAVIDDLLTPEALGALRGYCLEATVWHSFRYAGYLGAMMDDGFMTPLIVQIADELRALLPGIFVGSGLRKLWAFKYDQRVAGIPVHADFAAVNVNFWVTPDSANLEPAGGGLLIWDKEAPAAWDFAVYNRDLPAIRKFLAESGAKALNVPYRQNRAVLFNSDLFHETGAVDFRPGYENRRVNVTLLYGRRGEARQ